MDHQRPQELLSKPGSKSSRSQKANCSEGAQAGKAETQQRKKNTSTEQRHIQEKHPEKIFRIYIPLHNSKVSFRRKALPQLLGSFLCPWPVPWLDPCQGLWLAPSQEPATRIQLRQVAETPCPASVAFASSDVSAALTSWLSDASVAFASVASSAFGTSSAFTS